MRGATLHLNDMLEDREREQRRRARKAFAGAVLVALLGIAAAMREPPVKVIHERVVKTVEVECSVTQTAAVEKPVIVRTPIPGHVKLLPVKWPNNPPPPWEWPARHLCVTPKSINFGGSSISDWVTVSNVGDVPICITQIRPVQARGFLVDVHDCANRTLDAGERCTIFIGVRDAGGEVMNLEIRNSLGELDTVRVEAPPANDSTASPASPASRGADG
jgi:hypothetical protein